MVAAALRQAFLQADLATARQTWRQVADQLRPRWPKLAVLMDESEHDVLAFMAFPTQHRTKLHSTNPLERLNKEVKRRAGVVGIFPDKKSILRLIGAVLLEQNDEWQLQHFLRLGLARRVLGPYRQAGQAEPAQDLADRVLVQPDAEAAGNHRLQIDPPPPPVPLGIRPVLDDPRQFGKLLGREPWRGPRVGPVVQLGETLGVVAHHGIPQRLALHG
jgi:hypothetical protein